MLKSVEGIYRNGTVELTEAPGDVPDETPVIITFLKGTAIDLRERGITEARAAELRSRLAAFAEDWESPEMDVYDDYDAGRGRAVMLAGSDRVGCRYGGEGGLGLGRTADGAGEINMVDETQEHERAAAAETDKTAEPSAEELKGTTPAERMAMTWQLSLKAWGFTEDNVPRMDRSVMRIIRRKKNERDD